MMATRTCVNLAETFNTIFRNTYARRFATGALDAFIECVQGASPDEAVSTCYKDRETGLVIGFKQEPSGVVLCYIFDRHWRPVAWHELPAKLGVEALP